MAPSGDEAPFLRSILAAYGEDGPRLLFADYLEESPDPADQARAEFIRLQIALGAISEDHPRRRELTTRQNNLLLNHHGAWTAHLHGLAVEFQFRRGLLDSVTVDAGLFLAKGEELFRRAPIRRVKFNDAVRHLGKLIHSPHLGRVRELDFCGNDLGNGGLSLLLRSLHLQSLDDLDVSHNGLDAAALRILAEAGTIPRLRILGISGNPKINEAGARALEPARELTTLRRFDISGNDLEGAALATLLEGDPLERLHTLTLHGNHLGDAGLVALADSPLLDRMLARVPRLDLRYNRVGPHGVAALVRSARVMPAVSIDFSGNSLGDAGAHALALSSCLPKLKRLSLGQNRLGDWGAVTLAQSALMKQLTFLDVSQNALTQNGVDALFAARKHFDVTVEYAGNFASVAGSRPGYA